MKRIFISILLIFLFTGIAFAQGCGPNCPACSGSGSGGGALISQGSLMLSGLSIPTADEETTVLNARYGIFGWLDAGIGYALQTEKVLWNLRTQPLVEQKNNWRPGIILGTGSVQTGGSDQSVYAQFIKSLELGKSFGLQLSAGTATLLPDFDKVYGLAGITVNVREKYSAFINYDGISYHEGISWVPSEWFTLSFLMVESELPAISITFKR